MYPGHPPPGHMPPLNMVGEPMVYFTSAGNAPFVACPPSPSPYGPPASYGVQYPGMPLPGPQVMNFPVPFGGPSPGPHWQNVGPVMPMFGMPPPRQPLPYQAPYMSPHAPTPPPQQFRPPPFSVGPAPYMMTTHPGDDVFLVHPEPVMGGPGFATVPVRGPMQPSGFPPPHYNQGIRLIPQHPPNMHNFQPQPLMQFSGTHPVGPMQVQNCPSQQQRFATERIQLRRTQQDIVSNTPYSSQSSKPQPTPTQKAEVTQPTERADVESSAVATSSAAEASADNHIAAAPDVPETPLGEEKGVQDGDGLQEERPGNDSLDSEKTLVQSGFSSSHTSPSSSDSSLTLCSSPISPPVSDDEVSSTDADDIPTKDQEFSLSQVGDKGKEAENIAERDLDAEGKKLAKDKVQRPATAVPQEEAQCDSKGLCVPSGKFAQPVSSHQTSDRERNCCSTSCIEGKRSCPHRKPKQTNASFVPQQPRRRIRSQIDRPVFQEKPSRILTGQVPYSNSQRREQRSENQEQCVRSYLTTHFRLLFEPIPQQPEKSE